MSLGWQVRQAIRANRRNGLLKVLAVSAEKYLRAWHNDSFFEFDHNGERFVLTTYARWRKQESLVVWDVGAHGGEWASLVHGIMARAHIDSFEILPTTFAKLKAHLEGEDWSNIHAFGLSDADQKIQVTLNSTHSQTSAITPRLDNRFFANADLATVTCSVRTIDNLLLEGWSTPHLLKIDVEGHEPAVLRGAKALIQGVSAPELIQFEYGDTWLPASETLRSTQKLLVDAGYQVGRVFPGHVEFRTYSSELDNFRMGNFVAVKDAALRNLLSPK